MRSKYSDKVWDVLVQHTGQENAITGAKLALEVGCDKRQIQQVIQELRENGFPVLASSRAPSGYYIPATADEVKANIREIESRMKNMLVTLASLQKTLADFERDDTKDKELEELWDKLGDVTIDEDDCIDVDFHIWPAGTFREDIWHWFDQEYSKGVVYLMYTRKKTAA